MVNISNIELARNFCQEILIPAQEEIWKVWQKENPSLHWTKNNLWDLCYFACLGRWIDPTEAAKIANNIYDQYV